jgi:hypothetical protein
MSVNEDGSANPNTFTNHFPGIFLSNFFSGGGGGGDFIPNVRDFSGTSIDIVFFENKSFIEWRYENITIDDIPNS